MVHNCHSRLLKSYHVFTIKCISSSFRLVSNLVSVDVISPFDHTVLSACGKLSNFRSSLLSRSRRLWSCLRSSAPMASHYDRSPWALSHLERNYQTWIFSELSEYFWSIQQESSSIHTFEMAWECSRARVVNFVSFRDKAAAKLDELHHCGGDGNGP